MKGKRESAGDVDDHGQVRRQRHRRPDARSRHEVEIFGRENAEDGSRDDDDDRRDSATFAAIRRRCRRAGLREGGCVKQLKKQKIFEKKFVV